jgi:2-polyprenyl-3-methyl-5-hydroxy-6-metoxy-1,4-benzoquinol methylase
MSKRSNHWESVYNATASTGLSWFEREPATSLRIIETLASGPHAAVIDVGAGTSSLVDHLLVNGFTDVTVLDVSQHALTEVRQRLGERAQHVTFVHEDLLTWKPVRQYDIWHDRAVFHFLTDQDAREQYIEIAAGAIRVGGYLVLATFAEDGPPQCSGLPVTRYCAQDLEETFSASFTLLAQEREEHVTPAGAVQPFTWVVLQRIN